MVFTIISSRDYYGSITLTNLTSETSGLYRCTATNQLGSQTCAVELHIRGGFMAAMGIFSAITITLIMALVLLALFVLVLCLHQQSRGKWPEEAYSVENPSSGKRHVTSSPCSDCTPSSRGPPHILYLDVSTINPHPLMEESNTPSQESSAETSPALPSPRYSLHSGYLV
ncbi:coxsackievirus and adenovirus receptor homolog [Dendropsophus ebraccatus]|uniref:coxsackievirus and adenovirus receptor homolog n=1 Tax=Dendropsophus ebraccatus TaxID=150705 RepID=UPI0038319C2D